MFTPGLNGNGTGYADFMFKVQDDGGTANGGQDLATVANTMTIDVNGTNDRPAGTDNTVSTNEDAPYTFVAGDFGFTDPNDSPPDTLLSVKITTLPGAGSLKNNNVAVVAGDLCPPPISGPGSSSSHPAPNANGAGYASFTFQVRDDGGGSDLDLSANTMQIDVNSVNDAPSGADKTIGITENSNHLFVAGDFGFTDPNDSPANTLSAVKITTLPATGSLKNNGSTVLGRHLHLARRHQRRLPRLHADARHPQLPVHDLHVPGPGQRRDHQQRRQPRRERRTRSPSTSRRSTTPRTARTRR